MFLENKYTKWYYNIIESAKKSIRNDGEFHHIVPRSLGGDDSPNNLIRLSLREHYVCHLLLTKMLIGEAKHKMLYALHRMCFSEKYGMSSRKFESFRSEFIKSLIENHIAKREPDLFSKMTSDSAFKQWQDNIERRKSTSQRMKSIWADNREYMLKRAKENGLKGAKSGKDNVMCRNLQIEYKGKIYYGWTALATATGVGKDLYKRYYLNGFDPEPRIGKNGPISKKEKESMKMIHNQSQTDKGGSL